MSPSPRHPLTSLSIISALVFSTVLHAPSAHADLVNLVANGGFEAGAVEVFGAGGVNAGGGYRPQHLEGSLAGWDVGPGTSNLNALATNQEAYFDVNTGGLFSGPHSGDLAAVFPNNAPFDGYISQAVLGTVAGTMYRVSFWLSNQVGEYPTNSMTVNWGGTFTSTADPIADGTNLFGPVAIPVPKEWTYYSFDVVAPINDARLSFIGGNSLAGNLIDDVVVVVPEVSSFGVAMGIGLFALGATARVRRRSRATA